MKSIIQEFRFLATTQVRFIEDLGLFLIDVVGSFFLICLFDMWHKMKTSANDLCHF